MFNLEQLRGINSRFLHENAKAIDGATTQIMREAVRLAQGQNAIKDRTGKLRAGWMYRVRKTRDGAKGTLYNRVPHALFQELGTGLYGSRHSKYSIAARRAKMLRFRDRSGNLVFRRRVMHPGVKPRFIGRVAMMGHAAPFAGFDESNGKRIFGRWMDQVARRF